MARSTTKTELSEADRDELLHWVRSSTTRQNLAQRARILLALSGGKRVEDVAREQKVSEAVVRRWRKRYAEGGLEGLRDRPRSGPPRKIQEETTRRVLDLSIERLPLEATHWSQRLMAKYAGTTTWQVRQIWEQAGVRPHLYKTFKLSRDPRFAEKVIDVVGLYMSPPDAAMVLSVDEKTQIQALERTQKGLPPAAGKRETRTHDYKRHGTVSLYAAYDIASGQVIGRVTERHRAEEFIAFLAQIHRSTPEELDLHLIVDNSSTHKTPEVLRWLEAHSRFVLHFTPTSASWLNAVEGWFAQLERRALYRGSFTAVTELRKELRRFINVHNQHSAKPFVWTRDAHSILASVAEARRVLGYGI